MSTHTAHPRPVAGPGDDLPPRDAREALHAARSAVRRRWLVVVTVLVLGWVAAFLARALLGDFHVTVPDALRIIGGADIPGASFVLMESKLPRAVAATLAGLALGASGATFQTMTRNPLASPDVLGITMGCSAAAVTTLVLLGGSGPVVSAAAVVGGAVTAAAVLGLSGTRGGGATYRMILVGVALSFMLTSVVHWVLLRADVYQAHDAMVWLTGSLTGVSWADLRRLGLVVLVGLPLLLLVARSLHVVELGDDLAQGLGAPPRRVRLQAVVLVVLLVSATVSVCGPIAFVAFLSGPIARRLLGGRASVGVAALVGALVVVAADYLAAYAVPGTNFPVGVVTGIAGAPFLLWLLAASRSTTKESA